MNEEGEAEAEEEEEEEEEEGVGKLKIENGKKSTESWCNSMQSISKWSQKLGLFFTMRRKSW